MYLQAESIALTRRGKDRRLPGLPPDPQELRTKQIGHVIVNSNVDRPWSQYFCCMVTANREFVQKHPVATKRAVRAILKATNVVRRRAGPGRPIPRG
jgi:NitT/TauT family transport system substrate-binding protein